MVSFLYLFATEILTITSRNFARGQTSLSVGSLPHSKDSSPCRPKLTVGSMRCWRLLTPWPKMEVSGRNCEYPRHGLQSCEVLILPQIPRSCRSVSYCGRGLGIRKGAAGRESKGKNHRGCDTAVVRGIEGEETEV